MLDVRFDEIEGRDHVVKSHIAVNAEGRTEKPEYTKSVLNGDDDHVSVQRETGCINCGIRSGAWTQRQSCCTNTDGSVLTCTEAPAMQPYKHWKIASWTWCGISGCVDAGRYYDVSECRR